MYALIGIAAVFAAVLGGFLLENGNPYVLFQPAELLIVGGAVAGIVMVANPPSVMRKMWRGSVAAFRPPSRTPQVFLRNMRMLRRNTCGVRDGGWNAARLPRHILRITEGGLATITIPAAAPPTISNSAG